MVLLSTINLDTCLVVSVDAFDNFILQKTTPADYLAAAGEVETFEWVKEGHKRVDVEKDAVHNDTEFWAILRAAIACDHRMLHSKGKPE